VERLNRPLFLVALASLAVAVAVEIASTALIPPAGSDQGAIGDVLDSQELSSGEIEDAVGQIEAGGSRDAGVALPLLALLDGLLLVTMLGLGLAFVVPHRILARVVAPANLVVSIATIVTGVTMFAATLALLFLMLGLFLAFPFGTVAYLARWGSFPRAEVEVASGIVLGLKLAFCGFALAASPRLLGQKALVALVATSFVTQLVVAFLHGLAPLPLVSILDAVAGLVVVVVAVAWAVVIATGSAHGTVRVLRR
jgi:hypothetical protein